MKMNRRSLARLAALSIVALAGLAACSKKEETTTTTTSTPTSTTTTTTTTTTMSSSMGASGATPPAAAASGVLKVAFAYVGPVGDGGWTFAHDNARKALQAELGDKIQTSLDRKSVV